MGGIMLVRGKPTRIVGVVDLPKNRLIVNDNFQLVGLRLLVFAPAVIDIKHAGCANIIL